MTKIMLVEDDKSLREIYGVRLLAEGYDIVSAGDGEEALAMAIKERPALIVTDLMMPKISGFDMLDILRSTTETRNIKVIVMTALGSEEQRNRGDQLGADRYLVKSQVGIEDVVRAVHEVLGDNAAASQPTAAAPTTQQGTPAQPITPATARTAAPAQTQVAPATQQQTPVTPTISPIQPPAQRSMATTPYTPPASATTAQPYHSVAQQQPHVPKPITQPSTPGSVVKNKVIQPLSDPNASRVNINELLDRELAREAGLNPEAQINAPTTQQEQATVNNQIQQFSNQQPQQTSPTIQIDTSGNVTNQPQASAPTGPPTPPPVIR
ncbi:MAG: response regulator [Candidatus Woesebacteria bacterium]|jgi:DNA-binding response OmpR family regulator